MCVKNKEENTRKQWYGMWNSVNSIHAFSHLTRSWVLRCQL